jgi:hypothetical protein
MLKISIGKVAAAAHLPQPRNAGIDVKPRKSGPIESIRLFDWQGARTDE